MHSAEYASGHQSFGTDMMGCCSDVGTEIILNHPAAVGIISKSGPGQSTQVYDTLL